MNCASRGIGAEAPLPLLANGRAHGARATGGVRPRAHDAGPARLGQGPASQHVHSADLWTPRNSAGCSAASPTRSQVNSHLSLGPRSGFASVSRPLCSSGAELNFSGASRDRADVLRASPSMVVGEPPVPSTSGSGGGQDNKDFYLQCGVAVRTLREEIPKVFEHDLTYDIYREDITFIDHISTLPGGSMVTHGKDSYRRLMWSVRFHGTLFFSALNVRIVRIWQPREKVISVRWTICGNPRVLHSLGASEVHLDGISEYLLDSKGMIYEHKIESVDWNANHSTLRALNLFPARNMTPSFFFSPFSPGALDGMPAGSAAAAAADAEAVAAQRAPATVGGLLRRGLRGLDAGLAGLREGELVVQ